MNFFDVTGWRATQQKIFLGLMALTAPAFLASPAMALSPGCTGFNFTSTRNPGANFTGLADFLPGERLTIQVTAAAGPANYDFTLGPATVNFSFPAAGGTSTQHIDTTTTGFIGVTENTSLGNPAPLTVTFSCGAAPVAPPPPSTSSSLLDQTRKRFSQLAAQTTIANTSESVVDALDDAFSGNGTTRIQEGRIATSFAAIENAQEASSNDTVRSAYAAVKRGPRPFDAPPRIAPSPWHVWIDTRYTSHDDDNNAAFDSRHVNVTGGISYRFGDVIAGLVLGHENFDYELGLRNAKLDGNGWAAGGYFGWLFLNGLRLDGMLTYGQISYDAQADAVTAGFDADRVTAMLRLSGRWDAGAWYLEPSARLIHAWEDQDAFIDTAGVSQPAYSFNVGVASFGGEIGVPYMWSAGTFTPTLGLFGDYRFGDDTVSTVATLPDVNNGWSARVTGGLRWHAANGFGVSIGGDYGGLGQDIEFWRLRASLGAKF